MCLQEVQSDHYNDFLMPELQRAGYTAIFKKKTTELFNKNSYVIDGCATFFKRLARPCAPDGLEVGLCFCSNRIVIMAIADD